MKMQVRVTEDGEPIGQCGCGRSPTGFCLGWHALDEEVFRIELAKYEAAEQEAFKNKE